MVAKQNVSARGTRPAEAAEATRARRLREDARRPLSVNLAEGIELSRRLMRFAGSARRH